MMKLFFSAILIPYILILSIMPCGDQWAKLSNTSDNNKQLTEISSACEHQGEHKHVDACSPFCMCQCCGAPTLLANNFPAVKEKILLPENLSEYKNNLPKGFVNEVFQPPQFI